MTLALLLRYWKFGLIAVLVIAVVGFCHARDNALEALGAAKDALRTAAADNRTNAQQIRVTDTLYREHTVERVRTIPKYIATRDTLIAHKTDTALVDRFIAIADTSQQKCSAVLSDCDAFRKLAYQRFDTYEREIKAALAVRPRQHWGLGATARPLRLVRRPHRPRLPALPECWIHLPLVMP
jgi:hypothetical protein